MKLTGKDDFYKLKEKVIQDVKSDKTKLLVGLGTCGIAAGAKDVYGVLEKYLTDKKIENVELVRVGCVGFCYAEPTIEVVYPEGDSVLLGYLTEDNVESVVGLLLEKKETDNKHVLPLNVAKNVLDGGSK